MLKKAIKKQLTKYVNIKSTMNTILKILGWK